MRLCGLSRDLPQECLGLLPPREAVKRSRGDQVHIELQILRGGIECTSSLERREYLSQASLFQLCFGLQIFLSRAKHVEFRSVRERHLQEREYLGNLIAGDQHVAFEETKSPAPFGLWVGSREREAPLDKRLGFGIPPTPKCVSRGLKRDFKLMLGPVRASS